MRVIDCFDKDHWYLSNFTFSYFTLDGVEWETVEHYFQAMKTTNEDERERIRICGHPRIAKKFGRQVELRSDWEDVKESIMTVAVREKFKQNDILRKHLFETGDDYLIEGNSWHDNIWGDCLCDKCKGIEGQNLLGKILMEVRRELWENKS